MSHKFRESDIQTAAAAIANARGGRRGMPQITNVLDLLPPKLRDEVTEDARAVFEALQKSSPEFLAWSHNRQIIEQIRAIVPDAPTDDEELVKEIRHTFEKAARR